MRQNTSNKVRVCFTLSREAMSRLARLAWKRSRSKPTSKSRVVQELIAKEKL